MHRDVKFSFGISIFVSLVVVPSAFAQITRNFRGQASASFIDAPRYVQQELREAERAIAEDRLSDAVVRLGDLLQRDNAEGADADLAGQDFFLSTSSTSRSRSNSKLRRARKLIDELPPSALETYELRYGPLARKTLDDAAATRNWDAVRDVRRKYFHTTAGFEASLLLAQKELLAGHPLATSLLLDDIVKLPRAVKYLGSSVRILHAAAAKLSGRDPQPFSVPQGEISVAGGAQNWPKEGEVDDWLTKHYRVTDSNAGGESADYAMMGGSPNRNEGSGGQMPLENVRWQLETTSTPREARTLQKFSDQLVSGAKLPPPSMSPLRVGDQLLMRTTNYLFGVDYRTGKRVWNYPWDASETTEDDSTTAASMGQQSANNFLTQRVWNDLPYGQITSDGRRVFLVDNLNEVEAASISPIMGIRGSRPSNTLTNTLVALDLPTEGKTLWRLGEGADEANSLSEAFFLGPPLPIDGRLYVMVEVAGDILLVCLDPVTGDEIWRQQLASVVGGPINVDIARRISGATPTYSNGVLICPTGAGAIVAVDLVDRMLRWGISYPRSTKLQPNMIGSRGGTIDPSSLMQRWHNGTAIAVDRSLYITPTESDVLMCLDLMTGDRRFADRTRKEMRYLAGVRDDKIILVGTRGLMALDANTGNEVAAWRNKPNILNSGQQIVGRGVFGEGDFLIPTSSRELIRISLKDGKVLQRRTTSYSLGNLVAVGGELISQGPTTLAVAYGERSLEPLVDSMLQKDPRDFDALVRKSELLIQRNKRREALELLQKAGEIDNDSVEVRTLSVAAMLGMLRNNEDGAEELAKRLEPMIDRPSEQVEFLSLRIKAAMNREAVDEAIEGMVALSMWLSKDAMLGNAAEDVVNDPTRQCELDGWLAARSAEIRRLVDDEQLIAIEERLKDFVRPKLEGSTSILRRVVTHFDSFDLESARRALGKRLATGQSYLSLERLAIGADFDNLNTLSELSPSRLLMLSDAFAKGKLYDDLQQVVAALRESESDEIDQAAVDELDVLAKSAVENADWDNQVSLNWDSSPVVARGLQLANVGQKLLRSQVVSGRTFHGWQLVREGSGIKLRDPRGELIHLPTDSLVRTSSSDINRDGRISGGLLILTKPSGEISAIDLYKAVGDNRIGAALWRRNFSGDGTSIAVRKSGVSAFGDSLYVDRLLDGHTLGEFRVGTILGDRFFVAQGGDLMAIDIATSQTIWRNSTAPATGTILSDGKRVAMVSPNQKKVVFFDPFDGRRLGDREWDYGTIWASAGRHTLCYSTVEDSTRQMVRLINPFTREVKTELESAPMGRAGGERGFGQIVNGRYMVLLDSNGTLTVWDIMLGEEVSRTETPAYDNLLGVHAMVMKDQILVFPARDDSINTPQTNETIYTQQSESVKTASAMHAISLKDGELQWSREFDQSWGCTLAQPSASPLLLLARRRSAFVNTGPRRVEMDAMAIDVRDGKTLHERLRTSVSSRSNELTAKITVQPVQERVVVQIGGEILTYKFGETDPESVGGEEKAPVSKPEIESDAVDPFGK